MATHAEIINQLVEQMKERGIQCISINEDSDIEFTFGETGEPK